LERTGAEVWLTPAKDGRVDLSWLFMRLAERGVNSLLVEGGGTLAAGALAAGLVDRVYFLIAPLLIGGAKALTPVEGQGVRHLAQAWRIERLHTRRLGGDLLVFGDIAR
jgi:diaminohydroxyphosphoribosylaminopyrimidine deaminase/5-amino-6-(5-phosphoribosylamino)uracil reductase